MNAKVKKILNIALNVITYLLIAFTVFMMIFTIVTVTTVDKNDRDIFGFKFYIVQTDSMSLSENNADLDVHFNAGDLIVVKNLKDTSVLKKGDIICILEAMKMENEVCAPSDGVVASVNVAQGASVQTDDVLVSLN